MIRGKQILTKILKLAEQIIVKFQCGMMNYLCGIASTVFKEFPIKESNIQPVLILINDRGERHLKYQSQKKIHRKNAA